MVDLKFPSLLFSSPVNSLCMESLYVHLAMTPLKKKFLILLALIVLPVLLFSGYEMTTLNTTEQLITRVYRQQLDLILYSLNQYAFDAVSAWVNTVTTVSARARSDGELRASLARVLAKGNALRAIVLADSTLHHVVVVPESLRVPVTQTILGERPELLDRLLRYENLGYRKIEPLTLHGRDSTRSHTVVLFINESQRYRVGGVVLDERRFVSEILGPKLQEASTDEFMLGIFRTGELLPWVATGEMRREEATNTKALWLLPELSLGIRMRGEGLDEILRGRFYRNLAFIVCLDIILLAGAWLAYRALSREVELVKLKSSFVSTVSHELRTPLSLIRMYTETLEMGRIRDPEKQHEYHQTILREADRLSRLVNNILSFSRMESGRKQYHMEPITLNDVVREVMDTYAVHLEETGFVPVLDLAEGLPKVRADREAVIEAVVNVVDNAVKYSPEEHFLAVRTGTEPGKVFVEVEDHGAGIAPEHQKKIFDVFYRVSDGLVHNTKGSGLGLALVKGIMDAHGGTVSVRSAQGKGSRFRLLFAPFVGHEGQDT
jgi:two-component system, OmpR family, phosphate regulon sensor histidine kinase PhoR